MSSLQQLEGSHLEQSDAGCPTWNDRSERSYWEDRDHQRPISLSYFLGKGTEIFLPLQHHVFPWVLRKTGGHQKSSLLSLLISFVFELPCQKLKVWFDLRSCSWSNCIHSSGAVLVLVGWNKLEPCRMRIACCHCFRLQNTTKKRVVGGFLRDSDAQCK